MNRNPKGKPVEPVSGHLEILDKGFGFPPDIDNNYQAGQADTFVPAFMITKFGLREGSFIEGKGGTRQSGQPEPQAGGGGPGQRTDPGGIRPDRDHAYHDQHQSRKTPAYDPRAQRHHRPGPGSRRPHGAWTAGSDHLPSQIRKNDAIAPHGQFRDGQRSRNGCIHSAGQRTPGRSDRLQAGAQRRTRALLFRRSEYRPAHAHDPPGGAHRHAVRGGRPGHGSLHRFAHPNGPGV
jgi:hypothetical protein